MDDAICSRAASERCGNDLAVVDAQRGKDLFADKSAMCKIRLRRTRTRGKCGKETLYQESVATQPLAGPVFDTSLQRTGK